MKRLYYLLDSVDEAERVSIAMHANGITDWNLHVVAKDEAGLIRHNIHGTSFVGRTDLLHSAERGAFLGLVAGFMGALVLQAEFMQSQIELGVGVLMLVVVFFACFGAWAGGLVGISHVNYRLARFEEEIASGRYLVMIDAPKAQCEQVDVLMEGYGYEENKVGEDSSLLPNPLKPNYGHILQSQ